MMIHVRNRSLLSPGRNVFDVSFELPQILIINIGDATLAKERNCAIKIVCDRSQVLPEAANPATANKAGLVDVFSRVERMQVRERRIDSVSSIAFVFEAFEAIL